MPQRAKKGEGINHYPVILLNKPYEVLCQFTDNQNRSTLADYVHQPGFYPAGRLDFNSEGLVILVNSGELQHWISHPRNNVTKTYFVQIEGIPDKLALRNLRLGISLSDGVTKPATVKQIREPSWIWERTPPIRYRKTIPTSWLSITLKEGRNHQVRRMTAAIGHPTLRLIRTRIGNWQLNELKPGETRQIFSRITK